MGFGGADLGNENSATSHKGVGGEDGLAWSVWGSAEFKKGKGAQQER